MFPSRTQPRAQLRQRRCSAHSLLPAVSGDLARAAAKDTPPPPRPWGINFLFPFRIP
jgi:hypothetical protein